MVKPGMVNLPDFFTSLVATAAKLSSTFLTADPFNSVAVASSATIADFDIATALFIAACSRSHCVMAREGSAQLFGGL